MQVRARYPREEVVRLGYEARLLRPLYDGRHGVENTCQRATRELTLLGMAIQSCMGDALDIGRTDDQGWSCRALMLCIYLDSAMRWWDLYI